MASQVDSKVTVDGQGAAAAGAKVQVVLDVAVLGTARLGMCVLG
jgi:hypothetical protein